MRGVVVRVELEVRGVVRGRSRRRRKEVVAIAIGGEGVGRRESGVGAEVY